MSRRNGESIVLALVGLFVVAGCNKSSDAEATAQATSNDKPTTQAAPEIAPSSGDDMVDTAGAKEMFKTRCATCHGAEGKGNGPGAITLNPKPRNYTDKAWQAQVTDEAIKKTIVYGGAAVGKSPIMPSSPDLDAKPRVVEGLLHIVRDFGK